MSRKVHGTDVYKTLISKQFSALTLDSWFEQVKHLFRHGCCSVIKEFASGQRDQELLNYDMSSFL